MKRKGGSYGIQTSLERMKYPEFLTLKIGHSNNIKKRFSDFNTTIQDDEDKVDNNVNFIVHSILNAFSGTKFIEAGLHEFFKEYNTNKEFFRFNLDFDITTFKSKIIEMFEKRNICDISFHKSLNTVPYTIIPKEYVKQKKDNRIQLVPRDNQKEIVKNGIEFYKTNDIGGIYVPPGFGKTYMAILIVLPLFKKCLILTHRLVIAREWELCMNKTNINYSTINSENDYDLLEYKNNSGIYLISTYQTYLKKPNEFKLSFEFIIYDEAHVLALGNEFSKCLEQEGKKLFLTATPNIYKFSNDYETCEKYELNRKCIAQVTLQDAINQGALCDYRILIHNKPSTTECFDHINDLFNSFGCNKCIVFYNLRVSAKKAFQHLKEHKINAYYIDSNTSKKEREQIFVDFEESEHAVIVNVNVLAEGISLPCVDSVLIMEQRNSIRSLIQILGRSLRLYDNKLCSVFCIPINCLDTLETALTALTFDNKKSKNKVNLQDKILTCTNSIEEKNNFINITFKKLQWIEISSNGFESILEYKIALLVDEVEEKGKLILKSQEIDGIKLGKVQDKLIQCGYKDEEKWREKYIDKKLFKLVDERREKNKKKIRKTTTPDEDIALLVDEVEEKGKLILKSQEIDGIKLGKVQDKLIQCKYKNEQKWREKYNDKLLFKLIDERREKNKKNKKKTITLDEKIALLVDTAEEKGELIPHDQEINGIKLGKVQHRLIQGTYKDEEKWRKKYSDKLLFKLIDERREKNKKKIRKTTTPDEDIALLVDIVEEKEKLISQRQEIDGIKLGQVQDRLIQGTYKNEENWRKKYIDKKLFKLIDERREKNKKK